jgi:hypothetical protein
MTEITPEERLRYAIEQAITLCHTGNKPRAVRTFQRLLGIEDSPEVRSSTRGLIYAAEYWDIDVFEAHLRLFADRYTQKIQPNLLSK